MNPVDRPDLADAHLALDEGRLGAALQLTKAVLRGHPDAVEARLLEARIQIAMSRPGATLAALDAMELHHEEQRGRPDVAMMRLQALLDERDDGLALRLADQLVLQLPDDVRPHRAAAEAATRLGRRERAAEALRQVVRLCPSDQAARRTLVDLIETDGPEEAAALLANDSDAQQWPRMARLLGRVGRWRDAEELYRQLLADEPNNARLLAEAGRLADAMGDDGQAVARLTAAGATAAMADTHMHAGRLAAAGRCWWRLTRAEPASLRAWAGLLVCAIETGHATAAAAARRHLDVHASRQERQQLLATMWPHAACGLAVLRATRGDEEQPHATASPLQTLLDRATATLDRHARRHPRRADTHYHLAVCCEARGDQAGAAAAVGEALRLNPRYAAAGRVAMRVHAA